MIIEDISIHSDREKKKIVQYIFEIRNYRHKEIQ